ncbi:hypothetical protein C8Q75DRAFT_710778 [Abortiporus biennis]|nr:hypothetical protein C8Q75DRAFT_710778 [Abortiporus biennis]
MHEDTESVRLPWRRTVRDLIETIIQPDEITWIDDDHNVTDGKYISRALSDVEGRYERPIHDPSATSRIAIARNFSRLSCAIVHDGTDDCFSCIRKPAVATLPAGLRVAEQLLSGTTDEIKPLVRKAVYEALGRSIRHHTSGFAHGMLDYCADFVGRGLKDVDRSVRISAGRAFADLVRLHQNVGSAVSTRTEPLFRKLLQISDGSEQHFLETALLTAGFIGRYASRSCIAVPDVLHQVISFLISHLGHRNLALHGTAYTQLVSLAKFHNKTPYVFLLPYLPRIAPIIITRICSNPSIVFETSNFLGRSTKHFLQLTLPFYLPRVFANMDMKVIETIAAEIGILPGILYLNNSAPILCYAFITPKPGHTHKILTFIVDMLREHSHSMDIHICNIIGAAIVPLTAELVIVMGEEDDTAVSKVTQAISKAEQLLNSRTSQKTPASEETVRMFLKTHMLGVVTYLNERLQDARSKRTPEAKKQILRSLGPFVELVGPAINSVSPQLMSMMQTTLAVPELSEASLMSWDMFIKTLDVQDLGGHVGPTSAAIVFHWENLSHTAREIAKKCLSYIVMENGANLGNSLADIADLSSIPQLTVINQKLRQLRGQISPGTQLRRLLERSASDNNYVATRALTELRAFLLEESLYIRSLASGDMFDPLIGDIIFTLCTAASKDGEMYASLRLLAFECIGIVGAIDPDRFDFSAGNDRIIVTSNYDDEEESIDFALHLIQEVLVGTFKSTSDTLYQSHLAYTLQELLKFCKFNSSLVSPGSGTSVSIKVRRRWNQLPKHVVEVVTPLLNSRYSPLEDQSEKPAATIPIYPMVSTYRGWIQSWTAYLIQHASGERAKTIFTTFSLVVRNKDVGVAHYLLPHLVLNVLLSGDRDDCDNIRLELLAVLQDQVNPDSRSSVDKKELSAQASLICFSGSFSVDQSPKAVFMLMDHLNNYVRLIRQDINAKRAEGKKHNRGNAMFNTGQEEHLIIVDSILSSIDQSLIAKAALHCKAYARALMCFEHQINGLRYMKEADLTLQPHYERLHEIYAHLDEPDGMEGISTMILSPSLEHQIRQHESTGRWTSAQSCWEVKLQQSPNDLNSHLGLLRCLRNLGHYDTMRTHVKGILTRIPEWEPNLVGYQVETGWIIGNWEEVSSAVERSLAPSPSIAIAQVLLAMRSGNEQEIATSLKTTRELLGAPIMAAGAQGYRRSYDAILNLHLVHDLDLVHRLIAQPPDGSQRLGEDLNTLLQQLNTRLDSTLPAFRTREQILSIRRTAFGLNPDHHRFKQVVRNAWLTSAKLARKAGYTQTAYSATLQAQQRHHPFCYIESAKLTRATGEPVRALQELESSIRLSELDNVIDLTEDIDDPKKMKAKALALRARWMNDSDRFEDNVVHKAYQDTQKQWEEWESAHFHLGRYQDECYKKLATQDKRARGLRMNCSTVRNFIKAMRFGSKYIFQSVPRLLTIWLDMGENHKDTEMFNKLNNEVSKNITVVPTYKWYTAFPQIVSRVNHENPEVFAVLSKIIQLVISEYPRQALWSFTSSVKSTKKTRAERSKKILDKLGNHQNDVPYLISASISMTEELLNLCDSPVRDDQKLLSMSKNFPRLQRLLPSKLIIPLQESLTANLPPISSAESTHKPFPIDSPTFQRFGDEIEVMKSLAKPRKITIYGSNEKIYRFLGKPKDDLRKDARLMDFNAIINKLLKSNSESRRRQLRIRTYGVVTLNEECGFIQWVPNTEPLRPELVKLYDAKNIKSWSSEMQNVFARVKEVSKEEAADLFVNHVLSGIPPVFHEWFIETFPEPSAWLSSRLAYSRTAAVMSMVGFILGLGDRHCENILLDVNSGDVVHVDFNCLFEKGKQLETPEQVPFRLTQNIVDGMGVTGVEGVFRIACEITLQLLRDNKDTLMSVLDAFVHDPLVEWEDEKRKLREAQRRRNDPNAKNNYVKSAVDLRSLAKNALNSIEKKLKGIYQPDKEKKKGAAETAISTSSLVQILIQEAMDNCNLARMYPGWAPWH